MGDDRDRRQSPRPGADDRRRPPRTTPADRATPRELRVRRVAWLAGAVLVLAILVGAGVALTRGPDRTGVATRYARAWSRGDFRAMYRELTPAARERVSPRRFAALQREELAQGAVRRLALAGLPRERAGHVFRLPVVVSSRIYGRIALPTDLPVVDDADGAGVDWTRRLAFPGLREGEELTRTVALPPRATILARDGAVLAEGDARTPGTALADIAPDVVGRVGAPPPERVAELRALGLPAGTQVGLSGLERALDRRLLGTPGGELLAGGRVLARTTPRQARPVRSTIAPSVVRAALTALAGRLGGIVAVEPRTGEVLAYAGIAFSGLQPPGSTFKIVTLAGVLQTGLAETSSRYPVETEATLEGVALQNANGESCGGTLARSFALSCNSVFAPLGARLGAERLVALAERFGFNGPPLLPGAAVAAIPAASEIGDDLAVGSTAIGQGRVQATALQMAAVAATIADAGARPRLTLDLDVARAAGVAAGTRVVTPGVAATVERLMQGVVTSGTGRAAALPGVSVAGKTGTAELESTKACAVDPAPGAAPVDPERCAAPDDTTDTDAWFAAFAPAGRRPPRVAVGVLLVRAGAGGDAAAPVAREVLRAALDRG